ncbi:MAG: hypothetical protein QW545_07650 [Thermosphaera sp.]
MSMKSALELHRFRWETVVFILVENSAERLRFHELLRNAHEVYARIILKRRPSEQSVSK